jgi:hypothetical protein
MNQGFNSVLASSLTGVVLDCDLSTGNHINGGAATDNTAALNAFLATASATNPIKLILDGPSLVTGLVISSAGYTTIEGIGGGLGSGIFVASGSNHDAIQNGIPYTSAGFAPTTAAPPQTGPVALRNFMINGNRGDGTHGNSTSGSPAGISGTYWYCNITLYGVQNLHIEGMHLFNQPQYGIRLMNCSNVHINNNKISNLNLGTNTNGDGIHLCGPVTDVFITNNYLNSVHDAVAVNAPEGYTNGVIDRVIVMGNTFQNTDRAMRCYGHSEAQVGSVVFSGNEGSVFVNVIVLGVNDGITPSTGDMAVRSLLASGNKFTTGTNWLSLQGGVGEVVLTDCQWLSPTNNGAFIVGEGFAGTISSLTLNNCSIYRSTAGNGNPSANEFLVGTAAITIKKLVINGMYVIDEQGQTYSALTRALYLNFATVTISQLVLASIDLTHIALLCDAYNSVTSIIGPGLGSQTSTKTAAYTLLPTDGTVFVDATAGAVSITLPAQQYAGHAIEVVKIDSSANAVTLVGTISGAASPTLATQYAKQRFATSGTAWFTL